MRKALLAIAFLALSFAGAAAQTPGKTYLCIWVNGQCVLVSAANPLPVGGSGSSPVFTKPAPITWIAPTSASITASGTVVAAGPTVSIITNTTASGGGTLTLNLSGGTAVANVGIPLVPGAVASIYGQPTGVAITGICSTGTCTVGIQSGS